MAPVSTIAMLAWLELVGGTMVSKRLPFLEVNVPPGHNHQHFEVLPFCMLEYVALSMCPAAFAKHSGPPCAQFPCVQQYFRGSVVVVLRSSPRPRPPPPRPPLSRRRPARCCWRLRSRQLWLLGGLFWLPGGACYMVAIMACICCNICWFCWAALATCWRSCSSASFAAAAAAR